VGGQVAGSVIASSVTAAGVATEHGFTIAFVIAAVAGALGVLSALSVPGSVRSRSRMAAQEA
jgi:hypothetical protein